MTIAPNNKPNCETLSWPFTFKFPLFTFDYEPEYGLVIDSDLTHFYTHTSRHIFSNALTQGNVSCAQMRLTHIVQIIWLARVLSSPASMRYTSLARFACVLQPSADGHARARSRAQCAERGHDVQLARKASQVSCISWCRCKNLISWTARLNANHWFHAVLKVFAVLSLPFFVGLQHTPCWSTVGWR